MRIGFLGIRTEDKMIRRINSYQPVCAASLKRASHRVCIDKWKKPLEGDSNVISTLLGLINVDDFSGGLLAKG